MPKKELIVIADYSQEKLGIREVCMICNISSDVIANFADYEIIHPKGTDPKEWLFNLDELKRIKTALRLQHDLEMNLQSVAIVLHLLDEMESLRSQLDLLEKHFSKL